VLRTLLIGALWGALENLNMVVQRILLSNSAGSSNSGTLESKNLANGEELALAEELVRLSRLTLVLTFKAVQDLGEKDQLLSLMNQDLVTEEERQWLLAATPGKDCSIDAHTRMFDLLCECCLRRSYCAVCHNRELIP
jgi:hypothetical protein